MSAGPLRRTMAVVGLVALLPLAWLLATGAMSPEIAAARAAIVLVVVVVLGNVARVVLTSLLRTVEGPGAPSVDEVVPGQGWDGADRRLGSLGDVPEVGQAR